MKFHKLNIKALQKITPSSIEVTFDIPDDIREAFTFLPGQYLTIAPQIEDETPRRAYSICSDVLKDDVSILIKKLDGGKVSSYMNDKVVVNQRLLVAQPNGHFKLDPAKVKQDSNYVFLGAGSGITPLISMIGSLLKTNSHTVCHLFYGSLTPETIIYKTKLDRLKLVYKDRIHVHHFIDGSSTKVERDGKYGVQYYNSRVNLDFVANKLKTLPNQSLAGIFLCGPGGLIEASMDRFEKEGIEKELVHREYFTAPVADSEPLDFAIEDLPERTVTAELEGKTIEFKMKDEEDVLRQLMADGYEPPYSCLQGTCSTCKAKLVSGEVKMRVDIGLEADEIADGYILTCQSIPLSEKTHCIYENKPE